jgi:hypothetical protein
MDAALSSTHTATRSPIVLIPFRALEATSVAEAAATAGKCQTTIRTWCRHHPHIGRRIGGAWAVSKVALAMWLEEDLEALALYHKGARKDARVAFYYGRLKLDELLTDPDFHGVGE